MKKDVSFFEVYGKATWTINDNWAFTINEYYSPNFLNTGAWGNYSSIIGKYTAPSTVFGTSGVGLYVSGEFGRQWLGTSDSFYGVPAFPNASSMPTTTPGTSASASPTRCSRSICAIPTPTCRRAIAAPSPAITPRAHHQRHPDQSGRHWFQLVRCGWYRQALGRPDRDVQSEVISFPGSMGRQSNLPPFLFSAALFFTSPHRGEVNRTSGPRFARL